MVAQYDSILQLNKLPTGKKSMPQMTKIKVTVNEDDINCSSRCDANRCAVANAIWRTIQEQGIVDADKQRDYNLGDSPLLSHVPYVTVGVSMIMYSIGNGGRRIATPEPAQRMIRRFDVSTPREDESSRSGVVYEDPDGNAIKGCT